MLYIRFPSSKFPRSSRVVILRASVMINAARFVETAGFGVHLCLWHLRRGLFLDTCEPMWRIRERFPHIESSLVKFGNANVDQFKYIEGCEFGCLSPGKTPWRQNRATWKSWTCWWIEPFGCTVPQGWRRNPLKLLALVGWNVKAAWDSDICPDRVMFIELYSSYTANLGEIWSLYPLPNHRRKPPANKWAQINHEFDWPICHPCQGILVFDMWPFPVLWSSKTMRTGWMLIGSSYA